MNIIPFDDRDGYIWMNGEMKPWRECKSHVISHGLHYASLVFEVKEPIMERFLNL